jgi:hypothetical protein
MAQSFTPSIKTTTMPQDNQPLEERDLDEAAHEQLKEEEKKPIILPKPEEVADKPFDPDEEAHRQLEEGQ